MPFSRPTLTALQGQAVADITAAQLPGVSGLLQKSVLRVLSYVTANFAWATFGYLDWISRQSVPFTSTDEYLEGWAALKGVTRKPGTYASGFANFTGTTGTVVPSGLILTSADGTTYTTTTASALDDTGTVNTPIVATAIGVASNATYGLALQTSSVVSGLNASVIATELTGGADLEDDASLRTRMNQIYASPPQGGAAADYVEWALAVPEVTRAWAIAGAQAGSVSVYIMLDEAHAGGYPLGTNGGAAAERRTPPATGDQLIVANYIYPLRPVTALVSVVAPIGQVIPITIRNLDPFTTPIQANITAALNDLFLRTGTPLGQTIYPSDINAAIESVPGVNRYTLVTPTTPVVIAVGSLPITGTITYSA